jgi:hypothetical protein
MGVPGATKHFRQAVIDFIDDKIFAWYMFSIHATGQTAMALAGSAGVGPANATNWFNDRRIPFDNIPFLALTFNVNDGLLNEEALRRTKVCEYFPTTREIAKVGFAYVRPKLTINEESAERTITEEEFWWLFYLTADNRWTRLETAISRLGKQGLKADEMDRRKRSLIGEQEKIYHEKHPSVLWHLQSPRQIEFDKTRSLFGKWTSAWVSC